MSDNEMQTKSSLEESSGEESSSEAKFSSHNGEPVNKPRKDSTSSSSSSNSSSDDENEPRVAADVDSEDDSSELAVSKSKTDPISSSSGVEQPPQPRSRSVSVEEAVSPPAPAERKISNKEEAIEEGHDDTDDDEVVQDLDDHVVAAPPVPVERKVSAAAPVDNELTQDEVELSKRETVHMDASNEEIEEHEKVVSRKSSVSSVSSEDDEDIVQEAKPATIIEEDKKPEASRSSLSSSSSEDEPATKPIEEEEDASHDHREEAIESPVNGRRSGSGDVAKIYTSALNNNTKTINNNNNIEKERTKPTRDITQIYTQTIAKASPPASPKSAPRARPATDITKLYTGKLEVTRAKTPEPAEKPSPRKHNMSTAVDKDAIRRAYDDVRSDTTETEWAVFKFDENNRLGVTATGSDFTGFKSYFGTDDRGFGYIRIKTGDEMSKRAKFVLVTWVGPGVSVMKKAKMSTDKALMKDIIQNMSVELQLENHGEFSHDHFKMQVDKASGARYGTGVRDL